ncbi:MAG: hypothetical protein J6Z23_00840 [Lachnospiraceae bacterium]|nr:hypothetical protein [Lachnospiraceae bacterium]
MKQELQKKNRRKACLLSGLFALVFGTSFLLILSKSSPLYPLNDWVDVNCFFTMGRSMLHGKVLYRDLYEQKGPVLYFLFALSALISENSYIGVFLVEVLCFSLFVFISGRITSLYTENLFLQTLVMLFTAALVPLSRSFSHGNSVEELNLPLLLFSLWQVLKMLKTGKPVSPWGTAGIGAACAVAFWSKYTVCGFYAGLLLAVPVLYLMKRIRISAFFLSVLEFLAGFLAVSLGVWIYFVANGAVMDLYKVYFYNNITLYPQESEDLLGTVRAGVTGMLGVNLAHLAWGIAAAFVWGFLYIRRQPGTLLLLVCSFAGLALTTYMGGRLYSYYGLIFACYVPVGLAGIADLMGRFLKEETFALPVLSGSAVVVAVFVSLAAYSYQNGSNVYLMHVAKEDTPQYSFAEVIRETENPTLLNYGFLDGGFYYAAGIIPECRYFCTLNIVGTDMWDVQRAYINEGLADYVVTRYYELKAYTADSRRYDLVKTATLYFEGRDYTYYLYKRVR